MLSANEAKTKKFETTAEEIMEAGAKAISKMMCNNPEYILICDKLESVVAITAVTWVTNMQKKED